MIYFITDGTKEAVGSIKIGYSKNSCKNRIKALQTGNPNDLTPLWEYPGDKELEGRLHRFLSDFCIRGEWFQYNDEVKGLLSDFFRGLQSFGLTPNEHWWLGK